MRRPAEKYYKKEKYIEKKEGHPRAALALLRSKGTRPCAGLRRTQEISQAIVDIQFARRLL